MLRTHWEWRCGELFTTDTPHQRLLGVASELWGSIYVARHGIRGLLFRASGSHCSKFFCRSTPLELTVSASSCLQLPPPTMHGRCNRLHSFRRFSRSLAHTRCWLRRLVMPLNHIAVLLGPRVETSHQMRSVSCVGLFFM